MMMIDTWVRDPTAPMHLGPKEAGPLCPKHHSREPCRLAKAPEGPQILTLYVLWFQKEGAKMHMPD
jgi:hypothetical protein